MSEHTGKKISTFRDRFSELCNSDSRNDSMIAEALNVSKQTISAWRAGARSPKAPTVITIANYFNVDVAWLMGFDVERTPLTDEEYDKLKKQKTPQTQEARIISEGIDKMSEERRKAAIQILQLAFSEFSEFMKEDHHDET